MRAENQDRLKYQLKQISYSYIYTYDFSKRKHILSKEEWEALTDLRKDDSIIITKPDKGSGVVIINKLDYLNKINVIIVIVIVIVIVIAAEKGSLVWLTVLNLNKREFRYAIKLRYDWPVNIPSTCVSVRRYFHSSRPHNDMQARSICYSTTE